MFGKEIWAVGSDPVLHGMSCVSRHDVLLEDVSTGQQSSAVINKTGKETSNVVHIIHFSTLVNKEESSLATKTHTIRDHHMLRKLLTFSQPDVSFLAARPDSVVLVADKRV